MENENSPNNKKSKLGVVERTNKILITTFRANSELYLFLLKLVFK